MISCLVVSFVFPYFQTGSAAFVLSGHRNAVQACAFSPDSMIVVRLFPLLLFASWQQFDLMIKSKVNMRIFIVIMLTVAAT